MTDIVFTAPTGAQLVVGAGRPWGVKSLEGWFERPDVSTGTTRRAGRHGSFSGAIYAETRRVRAQLVFRPWYGTFDDALAELRAAGGMVDDTQPTTLDITQRGNSHRAFAWMTRYAVPQEDAWIASVSVDTTIEFLAADPFVYRLPIQTTETGPSVPGIGGLKFPLIFPLIFGTSSTGGSLTLTNLGNAPAWPVFELTGPGRAFSITDNTSGRVLRFDASYALVAGETLRIDTDYRAVTLSGVDRSASLLTRQWFSIPPGGSINVTLSGLDMTADTRLRATWYHTEV